MVKVLIVDDSPIIQSVFSQELQKIKGISVVGTAPDPFVARDMLIEKKPDVMLLDLEMPRMDGLTFLKKIMRYSPMPVLIVSALKMNKANLILEAMESGAIDIIKKPSGTFKLREFARDLEGKIFGAVSSPRKALNRTAKPVTPQRPARLPQTATKKIIAIGSSTGGVEALSKLLPQFPANCPPIVIVQHMPAGFTDAFAKRLDKNIAHLNIKEAATGDALAPGGIYIAPGNKHLMVARKGAGYSAVVKVGPKINRHRPSVDVLFQSVAKTAGADALGVILTGMGNDGAKGLLDMRNRGAVTFAQNEATCVVFGMPKEAINCQAACHTLPLLSIPTKVIANIHNKDQS